MHKQIWDKKAASYVKATHVLGAVSGPGAGGEATEVPPLPLVRDIASGHSGKELSPGL